MPRLLPIFSGFALLLVAITQLSAQGLPQQRGILDPQKIVRWSYAAKPTATNEYDLLITANIESGWSIYSQLTPKGGPEPTAFAFDKAGMELIGKTVETSAHRKAGLDVNFGINVIKFTENVVFTQHIRLKDTNKKIVTGSLVFMTCNDKQCLPPTDVVFTIALANAAAIAQNAPTTPTTQTTTATRGSLTRPRLLPDAATLPSPIKWTFDHIDGGGNSEYGITLKADVPTGWYLLSSLQNTPQIKATAVKFADNGNTNSLGDLKERGGRKFVQAANFGNAKIAILEGEVLFSQHIHVKDPAQNILGNLQYMVCNADGCLPLQTQSFSIPLGSNKPSLVAAQVPSVGGPAGDTPDTSASATTLPGGDFPSRYHFIPLAETSAQSLWALFLLGFVSGIFALLTPCVFPMIPMTVSFFLKRSKTRAEGIRNALIYGLSIIVIYELIGIGLTLIFGPAIGNFLSTHWLPNLLFFAVFVIFAFSFFGYYEITLPNSWGNKTDAAADKGGIIGIFFMAATLVIVSFSCTGPFLGTLLVQAFSKGLLGPAIGMLGFSLALALPFALFSLFPTWLKSLPKSGGWMNTLKVVFAFVELIMAVKFLSNIDLVYKFNILKWEPFLLLWALLFLGMAAYLFGFIFFPHDDRNAPVSLPRKGLGVFALALAAYSIYGMVSYQNLDYFSGLIPPTHYNFFNKQATANAKTDDCPLGLSCHKNDLDAAIAEAKSSGKPLFIDFTGDACVNCRKTENNYWVKPAIKKYLTDDYVVVSLICDDREALPENAIYTSKLDGKEKNTVGKRLLDLQAVAFNANSQPLYVLAKPLGKKNGVEQFQLLAKAPIGYVNTVAEYEDYLKTGLINFRR